MRQRVYDVLASRPGAREGRLWPEGSTRVAFEAAVETARLEAPFRFHDCRHHFASWFMMRGGPPSRFARAARTRHRLVGCVAL